MVLAVAAADAEGVQRTAERLDVRTVAGRLPVHEVADHHGGRLHVVDFFYTRESSPNAAARFRAAVARSPFALVGEEDWTPNAIAALEADSPRRLAEIEKIPRLLRGPALAFAGTTASPLFRQLSDGRAQHLFFSLQRR